MSLQVWLPLNGSARNQGLSEVTFSGSPASYDNSPLGCKCAKFYPGHVLKGDPNFDFGYTGDFSYCCWVLPVMNGQNSPYSDYLVSYGRVDAEGRGYGASLPDQESIRFHFGYEVYDIAADEKVWVHIAFVKKDDMIYLYKNGDLQASHEITKDQYPTYEQANGLGIGCFIHKGGSIYHTDSSMNDFRLYDHALSEKEIREISSGLVLHYPLNNIPSPNLCSGIFECESTKDMYRRSGYISNIPAETILANKGKTLCLSYRVKSSGASNYMDINASWAHSRFGIHGAIVVMLEGETDFHTAYPLAGLLEKGKDEGLYYVTWTIPTNLVKLNSDLELINQTNPSEGFAYPAEDNDETWYIRDVKVEWGDEPTPWVPNVNDITFTRDNINTICDTSGMVNDGYRDSTIKGCLSAPRNLYGVVVEDTHYIDLANLQYENMTEGTISFWIKFNKFNLWSIYLYLANNFNWTKTGSDFVIVAMNTQTESPGEAEYVNIDCCSTYSCFKAYLNRWYHITISWNTNTKTIKKYLDGEILQTVTNCDALESYRSAHKSHYIGFPSKDSIHEPYADVSDFRVYATMLPDDRIKELCNTPVSLSNSGVLITQSEFVEE